MKLNHLLQRGRIALVCRPLEILRNPDQKRWLNRDVAQLHCTTQSELALCGQVRLSSVFRTQSPNFPSLISPCHRYHENGPNASWVELEVRPFYDTHIFPRLASNQSAALVPGAFASNVSDDLTLPTHLLMLTSAHLQPVG
jgi:hypothetical protein